MERAPTADQLLHVWEQGRSQTPVQRARSLLALAAPGTSAEDLARYGIGRRDQELLRLYERIFGPLLTGVAQCPACGQEVELDFLAADLWPQRDPDSDQLHVLQLAGYDMSFRLPTCNDLAALDPRDDAPAQRASLLRRCIAEVRLNGEAAAADTLPEALTTALSGRMAELDSQGDIQLALSCPRCAHLGQLKASWMSPWGSSSAMRPDNAVVRASGNVSAAAASPFSRTSAMQRRSKDARCAGASSRGSSAARSLQVGRRKLMSYPASWSTCS